MASLAAAAQPPVTWPAASWRAATPESQGLTSGLSTRSIATSPLACYGNIDRMLVIRNGHAVVDKRYARDYREISRGHSGPLGCGEGCTDQAAMHEFNYFHPNWHPYYQGRDVHTLQSVTKSIAATVIGIALGRGEIARARRPVSDLLPGSRSLASRPAAAQGDARRRAHDAVGHRVARVGPAARCHQHHVSARDQQGLDRSSR